MGHERAANGHDFEATVRRLALPKPTPQFRRRAWLAFQQALHTMVPPNPPRPQRER